MCSFCNLFQTVAFLPDQPFCVFLHLLLILKTTSEGYNLLPGQERNETNITEEEANMFSNMEYIDLKMVKIGKEIGVGQGGKNIGGTHHQFFFLILTIRVFF